MLLWELGAQKLPYTDIIGTNEITTHVLDSRKRESFKDFDISNNIVNGFKRIIESSKYIDCVKLFKFFN